MTFQGQRATQQTSASMKAANGVLTGTWQTIEGRQLGGNITGRVAVSAGLVVIDATVTWNASPVTGEGACQGRARFAGAAATSRVEWVSRDGVTWDQGVCALVPTNLTWGLGRSDVIDRTP
jgi:hypothetical protein